MANLLGFSQCGKYEEIVTCIVFSLFFFSFLPNTRRKSPNTLSNSYCNLRIVRKFSPNTRSDFAEYTEPAEYTVLPPNTPT